VPQQLVALAKKPLRFASISAKLAVITVLSTYIVYLLFHRQVISAYRENNNELAVCIANELFGCLLAVLRSEKTLTLRR